MAFETLISVPDLAAHLDHPDWQVIDCRFNLQETEEGRQHYQQQHIPGAVYAHLDEDLSAPVVPGVTGRHPLPDIDTCARTFSRLGISAGVQVVAYDDRGGALAAARLWWMLRWLGHDAVAVLDGGWQAWQAAGLPTIVGSEPRPPRTFTPRPRQELRLDAAGVLVRQADPGFRLIDVRSPERYRGEVEPIDPVPGRIPGALSAPFRDNLDPDGHFLAPQALRERYQPLLGDATAHNTAFYCGSGATAAHGVLAMAHAGLGESALYAGSWSDWITDPARPVERG